MLCHYCWINISCTRCCISTFECNNNNNNSNKGKVAAFLGTSPSWTLCRTSPNAPLLQSPQSRPQQPGNMLSICRHCYHPCFRPSRCGIDGSSGLWGQRISKWFGTVPVADKWRCSRNFPSFSTSFSPYLALQCSGISGLIHQGRWWC